jgi:hypothetical protein
VGQGQIARGYAESLVGRLVCYTSML